MLKGGGADSAPPALLGLRDNAINMIKPRKVDNINLLIRRIRENLRNIYFVLEKYVHAHSLLILTCFMYESAGRVDLTSIKIQRTSYYTCKYTAQCKTHKL